MVIGNENMMDLRGKNCILLDGSLFMLVSKKNDSNPQVTCFKVIYLRVSICVTW